MYFCYLHADILKKIKNKVTNKSIFLPKNLKKKINQNKLPQSLFLLFLTTHLRQYPQFSKIFILIDSY